MKNTLLKHCLFVTLAVTAIIFTSCNPDNEPEDSTSNNLIQLVATNVPNVLSDIVAVKAEGRIANTLDSYVTVAQSEYNKKG